MRELYSLENEEALLGSILIDPDIINKININGSDFYYVKSKIIYGAMKSIKSIDPLSVVNQINKLENRHDIDVSYLLTLTSRTPSSLNAEFYAQEIRTLANRRKLVSLAEEIAKETFDSSSNLDSVVAKAMTGLATLSNTSTGAVPISESLSELFSEIEERYEDPKDIYGIETGIIDFDKITCGLQRGEIMILSGVPGTGKSMLAAQLAVGMASRGYSGAFYELEMQSKSVLRRNVSAVSGVKTYNMRSGRLTGEDWNRIFKAMTDLESLPIFMSDDTRWTTTGLRSDLSRLKEEHGIEWFVVDYMDLLCDEYGTSTIDKSAFVSMQLHNIAKDLNLAGIVVQSMNKVGISSERPGKEHLSGSVKVSYDADSVVLMVNGLPTDPDNEKYVTLLWDKQREGDGTNKYMVLMRKEGLPLFLDVSLQDVQNR